MFERIKKKKPQRPFVSAIIAAGGSGQRMGENKLLMPILAERPVLVQTLLAFEECPGVDEIIVVARGDMVVEYTNLAAQSGIGKLAHVVAGGASRLESVYKGMAAVSDRAQYVAVHDGARPCIRPEEIGRVCAAAFEFKAAVAVAPIADTVKRVQDGCITATEDREQLFLAQTPQVADKALLYAALQRAIETSPPVTDESAALERMGLHPAAVVLSRENLKITTREDYLLAGVILEGREL